mgnify:CR=1 FL=1
MSSVSITFPLKDKITSLGFVPDPKVTILVLTKYGYEPFTFLLDTGADCTMAPASLAEDIGIDLQTCPTVRSCGIEGQGMIAYVSKIKVMIGSHELEIKCLFSEKETTPYILGRMDIFSHFNITFDNANKVIMLSKIPR